jgi:hypothetical protein
MISLMTFKFSDQPKEFLTDGTMSAPPVVIPEELKEKVHDKLVESKALDRIDQRIKQGMCAAIERLRGDKAPKAIFSDLGFQKDELELQAIQSIYKYLASVGLTWTLETIWQETNVEPKAADGAPSVSDLLKGPGEQEPNADAGEEGEEGEEDDGEDAVPEEEEEEAD